MQPRKFIEILSNYLNSFSSSVKLLLEWLRINNKKDRSKLSLKNWNKNCEKSKNLNAREFSFVSPKQAEERKKERKKTSRNCSGILNVEYKRMRVIFFCFFTPKKKYICFTQFENEKST